MIRTDLTALTTLLCGAKEREKKNQKDSTERLNPYLVYRVVLPFLTGQDIFLEDICYEEFELEDIWPVADFFYTTGQAATIAAFLQTAPHHFRRRHKK